MEVVVNQENVHQIVQALFENVKSNQHRIDEVEPVLTAIASDVGELKTLLVRNGYAQAVKDNARELKAFRQEFQGFQLSRSQTCPTLEQLSREASARRDRRDWNVTRARIGIAALALIPTVLLIIDRLAGR